MLVLLDDEPQPEEEEEDDEATQPEEEPDDTRFGITSNDVVKEVQAATAVMEEFRQDYALEAQPSKGYVFGSDSAVRDKLRRRFRMLGQRLQKSKTRTRSRVSSRLLAAAAVLESYHSNWWLKHRLPAATQ